MAASSKSLGHFAASLARLVARQCHGGSSVLDFLLHRRQTKLQYW